MAFVVSTRPSRPLRPPRPTWPLGLSQSVKKEGQKQVIGGTKIGPRRQSRD
jgi:hypothetical protein